MGEIKDFLAWTNPLTYVFGIPLLAGFVLSAMFDGVARKTCKIIDKVAEDF